MVFEDLTTKVEKVQPRRLNSEEETEKVELILDADETVRKVTGRAGAIIDHLCIVTNKGRKITAGKGSGVNFVVMFLSAVSMAKETAH